ncbi:MAG: hypothetical protein ACI4MQ_08195 [Candidatus Coproplasma sp.]
MKKLKSKLIAIAAVAVSITMAASFSGCVTLNEKDVKQTVSTVNLSASSDFKTEFGDYADAIEEETVTKMDLIVSYLNSGSSYVQQGYTYAQVFDMLSEALVENAAVTQYATAYVLKSKCEASDLNITLDTYLLQETEKDKYEYLLGGETSDAVKSAKYSLYSSLNNVLDSYEKNYIKSDSEESYTGTASRTTPTGVDTLKEDYIPADYNVYTGYTGNLLADAGSEYEPLEGTNRTTRRKAYSAFINYLRNNYLLGENETDNTKIENLKYVQDMYVSQLKQEIISEFSDLFEEDREAIITTVEGGVYTYVKGRYDKIYEEQVSAYGKTSSFETAMDSISDTSFILYSPSTTEDTEQQADGSYGTYGYVYNILLPFSEKQSDRLTELQYYRDNNSGITDSDYFADRNKLLKNIETTDQRSAWFNGTTDYSFNAKEYNTQNADKAIDYYYGTDSSRAYLFFENNLTKTEKYEALEKYDGRYSYNGTVKKNANGSYTLTPKKIGIDGMLDEFVNYVNFVLEGEKADFSYGDKYVSGNRGTNDSYYATTDFTKAGDEDEIDYSKLVYATGKVDVSDLSDQNMFVDGSDRYKALCAVNELQYAYTTDTGILSRYIGYSVSAYSTSYIKEFEYAAQQALRMGVGAFKVCAGDYGWHIIYVTDTFSCEGGATYTPVFSKENVEKEGTFENRFYEWIKESDLTNEATLKRSEIIRTLVNDDTVKTDKNVYKDLSELDS